MSRRWKAPEALAEREEVASFLVAAKWLGVRPDELRWKLDREAVAVIDGRRVERIATDLVAVRNAR